MRSPVAPELEPAVAWLNCVRPLKLAELRGQLVILHFWTTGRIECNHSLSVLRGLEQRLAGEPLVVIGVHSARFPGETDLERVRGAITRSEIDHPVAVDDGQAIRRRYGVRAWPTLVAIRPDGTIAGALIDEPELESLAQGIRALMAEARQRGTLAAQPHDLHVPLTRPSGALHFPGKLALAEDGRLAIADSGHNRVLVCSADGTITASIGNGERGFRSGEFSDAQFDNPQGLAWDRDTLWICDAQNHCVRRADLETGTVTTVAGTGVHGRLPLPSGVPAGEAALRSPWDIALDRTRLYVAMAGAHQISIIDLHPDGGVTGPPILTRMAGSGAEGLADGSPDGAAFAQPTAVVVDNDTLVVVDSEGSALRAVNLDGGATSTLVGHDPGAFGHVDGPLAEATLQHPSGVARSLDGALVIADSYNDSLRLLDPLGGEVTTLYQGDGEQALREPGDIVVTPGGDFLVADTGNHRIARISRTGEWKGEFAVVAAPVNKPRQRANSGARSSFDAPIDITPKPVPKVGPGRGELRMHLRAPDGWRFQSEDPVQLRFIAEMRAELLEIAEQRTAKAEEAPEFLLAHTVITRASEPGTGFACLTIEASAVICPLENPSAQVPARGHFRLWLDLAGDAPTSLDVRLPLAP